MSYKEIKFEGCFIAADDSLEQACNASEGSGVFLVYAVADDKEVDGGFYRNCTK
jgi:hypothetical protein